MNVKLYELCFLSSWWCGCEIDRAVSTPIGTCPAIDVTDVGTPANKSNVFVVIVPYIVAIIAVVIVYRIFCHRTRKRTGKLCHSYCRLRSNSYHYISRTTKQWIWHLTQTWGASTRVLCLLKICFSSVPPYLRRGTHTRPQKFDRENVLNLWVRASAQCEKYIRNRRLGFKARFGYFTNPSPFYRGGGKNMRFVFKFCSYIWYIVWSVTFDLWQTFKVTGSNDNVTSWQKCAKSSITSQRIVLFRSLFDTEFDHVTIAIPQTFPRSSLKAGHIFGKFAEARRTGSVTVGKHTLYTTPFYIEILSRIYHRN